MSAADRARHRDALLAAAGWADGVAAPLAGDASFRSYQRLRRAGETAVLMDAPPPQEDVRPFVTMGRWLKDQGFSAPEILAVDADAGFLLLEDLGDGLFTDEIPARADEAALYAAAVDVLAEVQGRTPPPGLKPYSPDVLLAEANYLTEWYAPFATEAALSADRVAEYDALWRAALAPAVAVGPPVAVLRDYHAENLIWLPQRRGLDRVGLLDFQDALVGSVAYDLFSLLSDIRREVPQELAEQMIQRYLAHPVAAGLDQQEFRMAYAVIGAQRNTKIIGIFTRLCVRDGKRAYLKFLPRLWRLLDADLAHPALADLRRWFAEVFPLHERPQEVRA